MGGDHGPEVVIPGAAISLERHPALSFIFFGDEARVAPVLAAHPALAARSRVVHTTQVVSMNEKPSQALRRGKGSSMWLTLEAVQKGEAHAAVSAGVRKIKTLAVACIDARDVQGAYPCGRCRQIMAEFGVEDILVTAGEGSEVRQHTLDELLPHRFTF